MFVIVFRSSQNEVNSFLEKVRVLLKDSSNFNFIKNRKNEKNNSKYTNESCILELEYDNNDVISEIVSMSVKNYYQTLLDDKGRGTEPLFVFVKKIKNSQIYIKLKIKENDNGEQVLCISFHFTEYEIYKLPYA